MTEPKKPIQFNDIEELRAWVAFVNSGNDDTIRIINADFLLGEMRKRVPGYESNCINNWYLGEKYIKVDSRSVECHDW